jgi:general secretion pathway protein E
MVGEIRDVDTLRIAMQSALTGHMVLSTVHTNDAPSTISRLLDMGAEDYLLTSTVNGILAQRLVRTLCPHCRQPHKALPEVVEQMSLRRYVPQGDVILYKAVGCPECAGTGYWGRVCIIEVMTITDNLRSLVMRHSTAGDLRSAAIMAGMETMFENGLRKALAGTTTVEEVLRVTRED